MILGIHIKQQDRQSVGYFIFHLDSDSDQTNRIQHIGIIFPSHVIVPWNNFERIIKYMVSFSCIWDKIRLQDLALLILTLKYATSVCGSESSLISVPVANDFL
jgi:hypothetical protein